MEELIRVIVPFGCVVVLPITIVWLNLRKKMNEDNIRKEIVLAALEKNAEVDIENLIKKMNGSKVLLKEKLLNKQQAGIITLLIGVGLLVFAFYFDIKGGLRSELLGMIYLAGILLLAVGVAFLIYYYVGKKILASEIEAESKAQESKKE